MMLSSLKSLLETGQGLDFKPPAEVMDRWRDSLAAGPAETTAP